MKDWIESDCLLKLLGNGLDGIGNSYTGSSNTPSMRRSASRAGVRRFIEVGRTRKGHWKRRIAKTVVDNTLMDNQYMLSETKM